MYGEKLKKIRTHLSVTQEKMAELLKISNRSYTSYERNENNPPYSMLVELCQKHKINLNWFIADVGNMFIAQEYENVKDDILKEVDRVLIKYGIKMQ